MLMHSVKNHSSRAYFDEVMATCFRDPVFRHSVDFFLSCSRSSSLLTCQST